MAERRRDGDEGRGAARLLAGARERVRVARAELALPERLRLGERDRIAVSAMLTALVRSVEDELRSALASVFAVPGREPLHAALTSASVAIAGPVLDAAPDFPEASLLSLLLRRAEEHRLPGGEADEAIAAAAAAFLAEYDEGRGPDPAALRLARRLDAGGRLTDQMLERAAADGALPLLLAGLAVRTSLDPRAAWEIL